MSNLCYNCGNCHLPNPCKEVLKHCDICGNQGHAFNFCPLSIRQRDPLYQFWALCQNCDRWHLPNPCTVPLHQCNRCGNGAHLEYFCPVSAVDRKAKAAGVGESKTGVKRQRTDESGAGERTETINVPPDTVREIRTDAAREMVDLINQGLPLDQVFQMVSRPINAPSSSQTNATPSDRVAGPTNSSTTNAGTFQSVFTSGTTPRIQQAQSVGQQATPIPTPAVAPMYFPAGGQTGTGDGMTQTPSLNYQNPFAMNVPMTEQQSTQGKLKCGAKSCAACKKKKQRCTHMQGKVTDEAGVANMHDGNQPFDTGAASGGYMTNPFSGASAGYDWTPTTMSQMMQGSIASSTVSTPFTDAQNINLADVLTNSGASIPNPGVQGGYLNLNNATFKPYVPTGANTAIPGFGNEAATVATGTAPQTRPEVATPDDARDAIANTIAEEDGGPKKASEPKKKRASRKSKT